MKKKLQKLMIVMMAGCMFCSEVPAVVSDSGEPVVSGESSDTPKEEVQEAGEAETVAEDSEPEGLRNYAAPVKMNVLDDLNIRTEPDTAGENIVGMLHNGDTLDAVGDFTDAQGQIWYLVQFQDSECYAFGEFLSFTDAEPVLKEEKKEKEEKAAQEAGSGEGDQAEKTEGDGFEPSKTAQDTDQAAENPVSEIVAETGPLPQLQVIGTEDIPSLTDQGHGHVFTTYSDGSIQVETY